MISADAPKPLSDKVLEAHFARALEIAERVGLQSPDEYRMQAFIDTLPVAAFVIGRCRKILAANAAAAPLLPPGRLGRLADLRIDAPALARLDAWVSGRLTGIPSLFLPCYTGPEEAPGCLVATQLEPFSGEIGPHILVTTLDLRLDGETVDALCSAFSLSLAEAKVDLTDYETDSREAISGGIAPDQGRVMVEQVYLYRLRVAESQVTLDLLRYQAGDLSDMLIDQASAEFALAEEKLASRYYGLRLGAARLAGAARERATVYLHRPIPWREAQALLDGKVDSVLYDPEARLVHVVASAERGDALSSISASWSASSNSATRSAD